MLQEYSLQEGAQKENMSGLLVRYQTLVDENCRGNALLVTSSFGEILDSRTTTMILEQLKDLLLSETSEISDRFWFYCQKI